MTNFDDLKNIWRSQPAVEVPAIKDMTSKVKKNRLKMIWKNLFVVVALVLTMIFILNIAFRSEFQFISTKIGIVVVVIALAGGIVMNSMLLKIILGKTDELADSGAYLKQLVVYRTKQRFIQTKGIMIYFILLTLGLMLYFYEFLIRDKTTGIITYALTLAWIAFVWFYLRPRTIKKQEKKINGLISELERVSNQLKD